MRWNLSLSLLFGAYCSHNARTCFQRLAQYKPLIGALLYRVEAQNAEVSVEVLAHDAGRELPEILVGIEFVFLTHLVRKATKLNLRPLRAEVRHPMQNPAYAAFLGTEITVSDKNLLVFSRADAKLPFISCNESMWEFFEPELNKRLSMLETDDSYAARVRSALIEPLPSGECTIEDAAKKLGYSKRSLQRKLQEENTSFQKQLNYTRELLARYYAGTPAMQAEDIAYLLGYQDASSFLRAFSVWTGTTIHGFQKEKVSSIE